MAAFGTICDVANSLNSTKMCSIRICIGCAASEFRSAGNLFHSERRAVSLLRPAARSLRRVSRCSCNDLPIVFCILQLIVSRMMKRTCISLLYVVCRVLLATAVSSPPQPSSHVSTSSTTGKQIKLHMQL